MKEKKANSNKSKNSEKTTTTTNISPNTTNRSENSSEKNSKPPASEMDVLRKDCKSLLFSLQKHQNILNESLNIAKTSISSNSDSHPSSEVIPKSQKIHAKKQHSASSTQPTNLSNQNQTKTVSFSNNLKTATIAEIGLENATPRSRARSVSPFGKAAAKQPNPTKSILKKQLVHDVLSDREETEDQETERTCLSRGSTGGRNSKCGSFNSLASTSADSESCCSSSLSRSHSANSVSTGSLLASDIYGNGKHHHAYDYEENFSEIVKHRNFQSTSNLTSFMEYIDKRRQGYLNHSYENVSASYTNLTGEGLFSSSKSEKGKEKNSAQQTVMIKKEASGRAAAAAGVSYAKPTLSSLNMQKSGAGAGGSSGKPKATSKSSSNCSGSSSQKKRNYKKMAKNAKKNRPLLGFDWALGKNPKKYFLTLNFVCFILSVT
jgi:hypothetical protein